MSSSHSVHACHVHGVVGQPAAVFFHEFRNFRCIAFPALCLCLGQYGEAVVVNAGVVNVGSVVVPLDALQVICFQQTVLDQHIQIDEVRVACVGGKALVGGVAVAGGACGQDLPPGLLGFYQKVDEIIGCLAHGTDTVGGGQGGNGQQNAGTSDHNDVSLCLNWWV